MFCACRALRPCMCRNTVNKHDDGSCIHTDMIEHYGDSEILFLSTAFEKRGLDVLVSSS